MEITRTSGANNVILSPEKQENVTGNQFTAGRTFYSAEGETSRQEFHWTEVSASSSSSAKPNESAGETCHQLGESGGNITPAPSSEKQAASHGIRIPGGRMSDSTGKKYCHQNKTDVVECKNKKKNKPCCLKICDECLWHRYGDTVEEINASADWSCPKRRGCCNCSFCLKDRCLEPIGSLNLKTKAVKRVGSAMAASASSKKAAGQLK